MGETEFPDQRRDRERIRRIATPAFRKAVSVYPSASPTNGINALRNPARSVITARAPISAAAG